MSSSSIAAAAAAAPPTPAQMESRADQDRQRRAQQRRQDRDRAINQDNLLPNSAARIHLPQDFPGYMRVPESVRQPIPKLRSRTEQMPGTRPFGRNYPSPAAMRDTADPNPTMWSTQTAAHHRVVTNRMQQEYAAGTRPSPPNASQRAREGNHT